MDEVRGTHRKAAAVCLLAAGAVIGAAGCSASGVLAENTPLTDAASRSVPAQMGIRGVAPIEPAVVTPAQRRYLQALAAAGVRTTSDLRALSIGAYVCQARTADQSEQVIWDFVYPLVRSDLRDSHADRAELSGVEPPDPGSAEPSEPELSDADINAATARYIATATDQLC